MNKIIDKIVLAVTIIGGLYNLVLSIYSKGNTILYCTISVLFFIVAYLLSVLEKKNEKQ